MRVEAETIIICDICRKERILMSTAFEDAITDAGWLVCVLHGQKNLFCPECLRTIIDTVASRALKALSLEEAFRLYHDARCVVGGFSRAKTLSPERRQEIAAMGGRAKKAKAKK